MNLSPILDELGVEFIYSTTHVSSLFRPSTTMYLNELMVLCVCV